MKTLNRTSLILAAAFVLVLSLQSSIFAQGTAFTYQGRLNDGANPANGIYDFRFRVASDAFGNNYVSGTLLTNGVNVAGGLFTVGLDFGPGIFTGSNLWLEVSVRTNGGGGYATLSPLQSLTPSPYAIMAGSASNVLGTVNSSQLNGALPSGLLSGVYSNAVTFSNAANSFNGNGTGLSGVALLSGGNTLFGNQIVSSGNVGIGTPLPANLLHVASGSAGVVPNPNSLLVVERNNSTFVNVLGPTNQQVGILFGNPINSADGGVVFNTGGSRQMQFRTGGNNARMIIDVAGNVGIGATSANSLLSVFGDIDITGSRLHVDTSGNIGLGTNSPASRLEVVPASDGDGIRMTGSASPVRSPVVSFNDGPTQRGMLGLAETNGEFSSDALFGDLVLRANATKLLLQSGAGTSGLAITGVNNVGIGTNSPVAKLEVIGDIKLGPNGEFFADAGEEKLRVLRGRFNATTGHLTEGVGLTGTNTSTGHYTITFNSSFATPPTITVSGFSTGVATIATVDGFSTSMVNIRTWTLSGAATNIDFMLIVSGPR